MVVSGGSAAAPSGTPSKPITETSRGTARPRAFSQSSARIAIRSDCARIAVGGSGTAKIAASAASIVAGSVVVSKIGTALVSIPNPASASK